MHFNEEAYGRMEPQDQLQFSSIDLHADVKRSELIRDSNETKV